jgi:hypothetical protein
MPEPKPLPLTKEQRQAQQSSDLLNKKIEQIAVANGEQAPRTVEANRKKGVLILEDEAKGYVHVETLVRHLNPDQKSFTDEKGLLKIHVREFDRRVSEGMFKLFDGAEVIHDPRKDAPRSYNLKNEQTEASPAVVNASNIALREKRLQEKEAALDAKLAKADQLIERLEGQEKAGAKTETQEPSTKLEEPELVTGVKEKKK